MFLLFQLLNFYVLVGVDMVKITLTRARRINLFYTERKEIQTFYLALKIMHRYTALKSASLNKYTKFSTLEYFVTTPKNSFFSRQVNFRAIRLLWSWKNKFVVNQRSGVKFSTTRGKNAWGRALDFVTILIKQIHTSLKKHFQVRFGL